MAQSITFEVRGQKVRTSTQRRYVVIAVRSEPVHVAGEGTYVAFARIEKRSDNIETARKAAAKHPRFVGGETVVMDTATGWEI